MSYEVFIEVRHGNKHAEELDKLSDCGKYSDPDYHSERSKMKIVAQCLREMADRLEMQTVDAGEMNVTPRPRHIQDDIYQRFNVYTPEGPKYNLDKAALDYLTLTHGWKQINREPAETPPQGENNE